MDMRRAIAGVAVGLGMLAGTVWADEPKPAQGDIQYVEEKDVPEPVPSPLANQAQERKDALPGRVELSNGTKLAGAVYLTQDRSLHLYDPKEEKLHKVALAELNTIESRVLKEWMEPEWRWKENANDEKVYTGKEYPVRELETTLTFKDGKTLTGDCTALLYVRTANGESRFILHKRMKGEVDQKLEDLVYVKLVDLRKVVEKDKPKGEAEEKGK
jgi:hypothetical protein